MICPRVGVRNRVSKLKQVVLPAPFGPMSAWIWPRRIRRSTSLTARKPLNSLVRPRVSRMKSSGISYAAAAGAAEPCCSGHHYAIKIGELLQALDDVRIGE